MSISHLRQAAGGTPTLPVAAHGRSWVGREGLCRGENDEGKSWGNAEEARGNKNPAEPWGLRDENSILLNEDCQNLTLEYSLPMECI